MGLQPTAFGKRHRFSVTYDQMIEDADTQQLASFYYLFGYHSVRCARLSHAGRVIMRQNYGCRINLHCLANNFTGMNFDAANGTSKHLLMANNAMLIVEKKYQKHLSFAMTEDILQILLNY